MERGESSTPPSITSVCNGDVWAKLVPSDSRYSDIELTSNETLVCSEMHISSSRKSEWCRITRNMDLVSATFQNRRENEALVDEMVVRGDDTAIIRCGSEIIPSSGDNSEGLLRYRFKIMPSQESDKKQLKIVLDAEHAKCCICLNIWYDVVTVAPCLHNFCNGCFSEWLRRSQERRANVLCPQCRSSVQFVGRNHFLHSIEEDLLQADGSLRRSAEEIAVLDSYASIRSPLVMSTGKRKRSRSVPEYETREEQPCRQCGTEFAGYRCDPSTVHLQCHGCGGMMPSRTGAVPQHCLGCDRAFCGAYWHAQGVARSDSYPICSPETFKPITERSTSAGMPFWVHEKNRHEQDITESCIQMMGRTLQDVIAEWITKMENREIDRTLMQLNHAEMITARTHTCNDCYGKVVSFLLYWFRITMPRRFLSPEASQREDCWYGYACRTQHHNEEHARKRNHVCRPTRGSRR